MPDIADPFATRSAPDPSLDALDPGTREALQRMSEQTDRVLRIRLEQGRRRQAPPTPDQAVPPLPDGVDPVHHPFRPQRRDEMQTQAGREALAALLVMEQAAAGAIRREADARRAVLADVNLREDRRTPRMQEEAGRIIVGLLPTIRGVDQLHARAAAATERMAEARRQRDADLPLTHAIRRGQIIDALLSLSEAKRTETLLRALAQGDFPILGAVANWPALLDDVLPVSGGIIMPSAPAVGVPAEVSANKVGHAAITRAYEDLVSPELARERDELALLTTAAATLMSWTLSTLVEQSGADPYVNAEVHAAVAGWQAHGLDRWGPRDLLALRTWRQRAAAAGS